MFVAYFPTAATLGFVLARMKTWILTTKNLVALFCTIVMCVHLLAARLQSLNFRNCMAQVFADRFLIAKQFLAFSVSGYEKIIDDRIFGRIR
jgi:hypothetical protein